MREKSRQPSRDRLSSKTVTRRGRTTPRAAAVQGVRAKRPTVGANEREAGAHSPRVTTLVVDSLAHALARVLTFDAPADVVMSRFFRENAQLGRRDRSLVAEAIFFALRHFATLSWSMQPAVPARAPRLAALVTLARQFGVEALDPRALRGDAAAVKGALAIDLQRAPVSVRAELPYWLFLALEQQYEDAGPLLAALTESAPLDLRVNLIKASREDVLAELSAHAVGATASRYSPEAIRLADKPALTNGPPIAKVASKCRTRAAS